MKKVIVVFLFSFSFILNATAQNVRNEKKYNEIKNEFFRNYTYDNTSGQLKIGKILNDWYIFLYDYVSDSLLKKEKYWDGIKNDFNELSFPKNKYGNVNNDFELKPLEERYYTIMPCYGYNGFYKDNIDFLRSKENLIDDELYVLGRSYSNYAGNLLSNQYGFGTKETSLNKKYYHRNLIPQIEINKYLSYQDSCLEVYRKLANKNPNYNTRVVGSIYTKLCNEYMYRDLILRMYANDSIANSLLPQNLYNEVILSYAKSFLEQCPPNSILFVEGDNDTYPVWYLQFAKNVRTDVSVINISLLGTEIYPNYLYDSRKVPISFHFEDSNKDDVLYLTINNSDRTKKIKLNEFISTLKNKINKNENSNNNDLLNLIDAQNIEIKNTEYLLPKIMYRNTILLLDIINSNNFERPICFTSLIDQTSFYNLFSSKCSYNSSVLLFNKFNSKLAKPFVLKNEVMKFIQEIKIDSSIALSRSDSYISDFYKSIFNQIGYKYYEEEDNDNLKKVVDLYIENFPPEKFKLNNNDYLFLYLYNKVYLKDKAALMAERFLKAFKVDDYINEKEMESQIEDFINAKNQFKY